MNECLKMGVIFTHLFFENLFFLNEKTNLSA
jgi:hypothetical protein